ncbi:4'-phosphopantetheinyl transferase family protein [Streptomyces sp. NPDC059568]|uniref:4'-phosphopantetheinyl transferase family protein n=1 Tax=Streptomyces sp. NPDC059568 TaxID=3346868 RepID=UPI0036A0155E
MTGLRPVRVADGVHVAVDRIEDLREVPAAPADLRSAARLPVWRMAEHLAARTLLRRLLAGIVGPSAAREPVAAHPGGRPYLPGRPDLGISLSHTDGWVAVAVHTVGGAVGVDVQAAVPASERLIRRCCSPVDRAVLARMGRVAREIEFAWVWSAQEACVKATGAGISGLPWTVPVAVGQCEGRWGDLKWSALHGRCPVPVSCAYQPAADITTDITADISADVITDIVTESPL